MEKCGYRTVTGPDANGLYLGAPPVRNQKFADLYGAFPVK